MNPTKEPDYRKMLCILLDLPECVSDMGLGMVVGIKTEAMYRERTKEERRAALEKELSR